MRPGEAHLVDRDRGHRHRDAGLERGLARGDLALAGLQHLAHDHVVDLLGADAAAVERGLDREATEVHGREAASAPDSLPIGVRADETMTDPGIGPPQRCAAERCGRPERANDAIPRAATRPARSGHGEIDGHPGYVAGMSTASRAIRDDDRRGRAADDRRLPLPTRAVVRADEQEMFAGMPSEDKDPRKSSTSTTCRSPELAPDEAYVAVMASSINFNTVWTSIFEPLPTFEFLQRLGKESVWGARHDQPYHVIGSDAAGVVLRVGSAVRNWKPGDAVTVHCNHVDDQDPTAHDDSMLASNQRIWGYETNFGGLGEIAVVKANQLMPKPAHLTWEEAAVNALTNSTSYRMLVSPNGAQMTQGQTVLIWGASGGIGAYACQYVLNGGGTPVGGRLVAASAAALLHEMGVEHVIDRKAEGYRFWSDDAHAGSGRVAPARARRSASSWASIPRSCSSTPAVQTMGASVFVCARGGTIITCAATSGFMIEYDNRYLWMNQKTLKGCHFANYREAWEANRLICEGQIHPTLSAVFPFDDVGEAAYQVHKNLHEGKLGVLVLAPKEGLGVTNAEMRERLLPQITLFRHGASRRRGATVMSDASVLTEIDHIAIAVRDLDAAVAYYADTYGVDVDHREVVERDGVEEALLKVADSYVQLLTPIRDDSPVAKWMEKQGEGHPPRRLPGRRLRGRPRPGEGPGPPGDRRGAPPRQPGHDGRLRPPQDRLRHPHRARRGMRGNRSELGIARKPRSVGSESRRGLHLTVGRDVARSHGPADTVLRGRFAPALVATFVRVTTMTRVFFRTFVARRAHARVAR